MRILYSISISILTILTACEKPDEIPPQIDFKVNNEILLNDTLRVAINGYHEVIIETSGGTTGFYRQVNSERPVSLRDSEDLRILKQSSSPDRSVTAEVFTSFSDSLFTPNDVVRIKVRVSDYVRSLYYIIH